MKTTLFIFSSLLICTILSATTENLVRNGDFSEGWGSGETRSFGNTSVWYNWGTGDQGQIARRQSSELGSDYVAQVNDRYNVLTAESEFDKSAFGPINHVQRTRYMIQDGDAFRVQYTWVDSHDWNRAWDEIRFVLFATDTNTLAGDVVWTSILDSGTIFHSGHPQIFDEHSDKASAEAVGRELFVAFFGFQNNFTMSNNTGFARLGNLVVTVEP